MSVDLVAAWVGEQGGGGEAGSTDRVPALPPSMKGISEHFQKLPRRQQHTNSGCCSRQQQGLASTRSAKRSRMRPRW